MRTTFIHRPEVLARIEREKKYEDEERSYWRPAPAPTATATAIAPVPILVEWVRLGIRSGHPRSAHSKCVEYYNSTVDCGADHGGCGSPLCSFSSRYNRELSEQAYQERLSKKK